MRVTSACLVVLAVGLGACGAGETRVDPGDLELHDLLGVAPEVAIAWDADQRASARRVLATAMDDASIAAMSAPSVVPGDVVLANEWDGHTWSALPGRGAALLVALGADAGHRPGRLVVAPAPRMAAIATYEDARLVVNPVVLAAIEPAAMEAATSAQLARVVPATSAARPATNGVTAYEPVSPQAVAAATGNPYSFYGSVAECAFAQRARCDECLPAGTCEPITDSDGPSECTRLGETNGRGYYLICINLALAISSVDNCAVERASGCARDTDASDTLAELEANAHFLDDAACRDPLDACLGEIYGEPPEDFPDLDGGITPPRDPRPTAVDCGDSCDSSNNNCEASPSCDCEGPSCNNSFSCDSTCASSNSGGGGCGNCDACESDSGGGGGDCGGGSSGGGGGGGGDCGGGGSSGGGGCSGGDCGGGGGGCGGSGGGGCGGGGGGCNSGGGGGSCNVAKRGEASGNFVLVLSIAWAFAPLPVALAIRRRARRRRPSDGTVASEIVDDPPSSADKEVVS